MADITVRGQDFYNVPDVTFPKVGGGTATYTEGGGGGANLMHGSKNVTPSETAYSGTETPSTGYDGFDQFTVSVEAIPDDYIGSAIDRRSSSDLTASGATVAVPAGFYENAASKSVASGTEGTPSATKGAVTDHAVEITPSVTNTEGHINGGTHSGTPVRVEASELVSGSTNIVGNGTFNVTNLAQVVVDVSSIGTLLNTKTLGNISTSSTSATDTGQTVSVSGINNYDALVVITYVQTQTNNRHVATLAWIWLYNSSSISTKSTAAIGTAKLNMKRSSSGTVSSRSNTTAYGIYPNSCTITNGAATISMYQRYNSTQTGTINGNYITKVYGLKLYNLIGG